METVRRYFQAQGLFGMPARGQCDYTSVLDVDLAEIEPSVAGPKEAAGSNRAGPAQAEVPARWSPMPMAMAGPQLKSLVASQCELGTTEKPHPGGGEQSSETLPDGPRTNTNPLTETEMINNRPTPNRLGQCGPATC